MRERLKIFTSAKTSENKVRFKRHLKQQPPEVSVKLFLNISQISQENACV